MFYHLKVSLDLNSKFINEKNSQSLFEALTRVRVQLKSLDLSFNQFFKDESMQTLLDYMEEKSIEILDSDCKVQTPIIASLK